MQYLIRNLEIDWRYPEKSVLTYHVFSEYDLETMSEIISEERHEFAQRMKALDPSAKSYERESGRIERDLSDEMTFDVIGEIRGGMVVMFTKAEQPRGEKFDLLERYRYTERTMDLRKFKITH